jgi:hypothetical protein
LSDPAPWFCGEPGARFHRRQKRTVRHLGISVIDSAPAASLVRPDLLDEPSGANSVRFCLRSSHESEAHEIDLA